MLEALCARCINSAIFINCCSLSEIVLCMFLQYTYVEGAFAHVSVIPRKLDFGSNDLPWSPTPKFCLGCGDDACKSSE